MTLDFRAHDAQEEFQASTISTYQKQFTFGFTERSTGVPLVFRILEFLTLRALAEAAIRFLLRTCWKAPQRP